MTEIDKQEFEDHVLLTISGEVDASSSIHLDNAISETVSLNQPLLLIDLTHLNYISSAGLGVFMSYIEEFKQRNKKMILFGLNEKVNRVFEILGLHELLKIAATKEEALSDGV